MVTRNSFIMECFGACLAHKGYLLDKLGDWLNTISSDKHCGALYMFVCCDA